MKHILTQISLQVDPHFDYTILWLIRLIKVSYNNLRLITVLELEYKKLLYTAFISREQTLYSSIICIKKLTTGNLTLNEEEKCRNVLLNSQNKCF